MSDKIVIGIDVAKSKVDVCRLPSKESFTVMEKDYDDLAEKLKAMSPNLVVLEATGGYERQFATRLAAAEIPFHVANPGRVRAYAKALNFLAKTDSIDAFVIAHFGMHINLQPRLLGEEKSLEMRAFLVRRRQLIGMRTSETNR